MDYSMPSFPVLYYLSELFELMFIELVMSSKHLILCRPLLPLPSIFPSIRVFSSELALHIGWSKSWSFSFAVSLPHEYSGLISFRIDFGYVKSLYFYSPSPMMHILYVRNGV